MEKKLNPLFAFAILLLGINAYAQNPKFHIYLCIGQSNMEGFAKFEAQDTVSNERFKVLQAIDCDNLKRKKGQWYTAVPPLNRCNSGLSPADYFGKEMIANLPKDVTVGVINVASKRLL